jgi:prepilin-type N-terminal cleavage/methylation domain-containing protein
LLADPVPGRYLVTFDKRRRCNLKKAPTMSTLKRLHRQARARRDGRPAFTLLELIVVLLVLGILAAIATPTFNRVKENSVQRVAQTTLEAIDRNGEAIASSDTNMTDAQVAEVALSEIDAPEGMTLTRVGAQVTVQKVSGSVLAEGTVTFVDGVGTIDPAVADPDGAPGSSSPSTTTTLVLQAPAAPTGVGASQGNAVSTITWSWGVGNAYPGSAARPIDSVTLKSCTDQGMTENCLTKTPTTDDLTNASYVWTSLDNGTTRYFAVIASNAVGDAQSDPSSPVTPYQPPTAAPTLTVAACIDNSTPACAGGQTLELSWTTVTSTASEPVDGYNVYRLNPTSDIYELIAVTTNTTYTASGLVNGTSQSFKVAAYNALDTGALSNVGTATPYTLPGSPTGVSATATPTSGAVSFSAPASDGGSSITSYTVTCANTSGGSAASTTGSASPLTVTLAINQSYTCTTSATNAAGAGAASPPLTLNATYTSQGNYTCPSGGSLSGSTCTQTVLNYTYSCPYGGSLGGSTCYAGYGSIAYGPGIGCNTQYGWSDYGAGCATAATVGSYYTYPTYGATWQDTGYWSRGVT